MRRGCSYPIGYTSNSEPRSANSPGALTRYLGATKGTVSQTLMALARKGYVSKSQRTGSGVEASSLITRATSSDTPAARQASATEAVS